MEDDGHHLIKIKLNEMYKCIQISSINTLYLQTRMNIEILNIESFCEDDTLFSTDGQKSGAVWRACIN